ncbi:hypothetical protein N0V83_002548 [Neocucurbitaria cava]|uniref:Uncharacterized protein n=1 Tax=Neocucurbitaria cava TaxID=798079 RepID=A0A9W8YCE6_9PLEO|nr:hypothetical protein N0V83_002548 [Neocucurbitaria cava]
MAGTMDKIKAKVDQVMHKDKTHDDTTGPHSSHAANEADSRVNTTGPGHTGATGHSTTGTTGGLTGSSTTGGYGNTAGHHNDPTGPHDSKLGNKADPRVDSDRYGAAGNTSGAGGYGTGQYGEGHHTQGHHTAGHGTTATSAGGLTGALGGEHYTSDPTGPHETRTANKLDPRVDSDRYGATGNTSGAGGYGTGQYGEGHHTQGHSTTGGGLTGGGMTGSSTTGGYGHSDPTGPHDSRLGNKTDPRVDSDRYGTSGNTTGAGGFGTGQHGEGHHTAGGAGGFSNTSGGVGHHNDPSGPHDSRLGNKTDPRVDSDRYGAAGNTSGAGGYGTGQYGEGQGHHTQGHQHGHENTAGGYGGGNNTVGSGNSKTTAGPHNSDMLNKLDPRVDSDLDGGKTYGGNATRQ